MPETKFVVDSVEPMQNIKCFTDTLRCPHRQCWKEAVHEYYDNKANVSLYYIPFPENNIPPHAKICKPMLAPSIKLKDDMPNYHDL